MTHTLRQSRRRNGTIMTQAAAARNIIIITERVSFRKWPPLSLSHLEWETRCAFERDLIIKWWRRRFLWFLVT
jgi:hypothetical protein